MRKIFSYAALAAMIVLAWSADGASAAQKKGSSAKKGTSATRKGTGPASTRKPGTAKNASSRGKKTTAKRVTWRNRQMSPSPDRYREIQSALAAKGFLPAEGATGTWNQASTDAMKRFQSEQNLESSGKINSLSLIALGLGPRRDAAPAIRPPPQAPVQ